MSNQLSLTEVKKENEIYKERISFDVKVNGNDFTINMTPYFSPFKVENLVTSYSEFAAKAGEEKVTIRDNEAIDIVHCFVIKEFTDVKFSNAKKAKSILAEFKQLMNNRLYKELMMAFPPESLNDVYEALQDKLAVLSKLQNDLVKTKLEIDELPLENRDILFKDE